MRSRGASREVRTQVVVSLEPSPPKPLAPRGRLPGPRLWAPYPSRPGGPAPPPLDQRHLASFQVCSWPVPEGDPGCPSPGRVPPPPPRGAGWAQQLHWGRERWGAAGGDGEAKGHLLPLPWQPAWPALSPRYPPNGLHAAADHRPLWCPCWGPHPHGGQSVLSIWLGPTLALLGSHPPGLLEMSRLLPDNPRQSVSFSGVLEPHRERGGACRRSRSLGQRQEWL